jgi:flagellar biosynthesis chaperone FliJ
MLRFIAELPETLQQLAGREKEKLERELQKLLRLVEEFKEAIRSFAGENKKKGTMLARMYRNVTSTAR